MMTPIIESLLAEYGIKFCYRLLKRHGPNIVKKVDAKILNLINSDSKDFVYYCPDCLKEFELFKDETKDRVNFINICSNCESKNIHLKNKKLER